MKLKRKTAEVEAIRLSEAGTITLDSTSTTSEFKKGDWLVVKDGSMSVMTENELRRDYDFPTTAWKKTKPLKKQATIASVTHHVKPAEEATPEPTTPEAS